jgi:predicted acetyltransferase
VRYQGKQIWDDMVPNGLLTLDELVALTPAADRRLWQYCCDIDLMATLEAGDRSVAEPLAFMLSDGRAIRQSARFDFVWLRVLDVCGALASRRYEVDGGIVIEVIDPMGFAGGRYSLEGGPAGATCAPSRAEPELTMPVDALGSIYLGGVPVRTLAAAGRVEERRSGALAKADLMFRSHPVPWCSTWF